MRLHARFIKSSCVNNHLQVQGVVSGIAGIVEERESGENLGRHEVTFISALGFQKLGEEGSGRKHWTMSFFLSWSNSVSVTICLKGQLNRASYSPLMMVRKKERWVPFPEPSPFRYNLKHILYPNRLVKKGALYSDITFPTIASRFRLDTSGTFQMNFPV